MKHIISCEQFDAEWLERLFNLADDMMEHPENCVDPRGKEHVEFVFEWLGKLMQCDSAYKGLMMFRTIMFSLDMQQPVSINRTEDLDVLTYSVNPVRLKNNPVLLSEEVIAYMYSKILKSEI